MITNRAGRVGIRVIRGCSAPTCFNGDDTDPVLPIALDRGTRREFEANQPQYLYIDYLLEKPPHESSATRSEKPAMRELAEKYTARPRSGSPGEEG